jgi:hypothetical protein
MQTIAGQLSIELSLRVEKELVSGGACPGGGAMASA